MVRDILDQAVNSDPPKIVMSERKLEATIKLRDFLYDRVYDLPTVHGDFMKSAKIIRELYAYFLEQRKEFRKEAGRPSPMSP